MPKMPCHITDEFLHEPACWDDFEYTAEQESTDDARRIERQEERIDARKWLVEVNKLVDAEMEKRA